MKTVAPRGVTLIDALVGSAITLVIFVALFGLLRASLITSSVAKSKAVATAIASSQMEYIRSLTYDAVGTVGGIPAGVVAPTATTTENGVGYNVRTFIQYIDDPADGLAGADETGIITDYKRVKVSVTYYVNGSPRTVDLISNESPVGIETTTGGGTLEINVVDAVGAALAGAEVTIENPSLSPAVTLTAFSNDAGIVYLPGAATSTDYRVSVTKTGYSVAQTYARDTTNQNPTPGYLTVVENTTTSGTFAIDQLASLAIRTYEPVKPAVWDDTFTDSAALASLTNTTASGGALMLTASEGVYATSGSARSIVVTPPLLASWTQASSTVALPAGTTITVTILDGVGNPLPDAVLPGNSAGFSTFPIDLSVVPVATYPSLSLRADVTTTDTLTTPTLEWWSLGYTTGPTPLPNIAFTLTGAKTIGSTGAGAALYKTDLSEATDGSGNADLALEWDAYRFIVAGYDVVDACNAPPYTLSPGESLDSALTLGQNTTNMLLVSVVDASGNAIPGASVTVSRTGYSKTVTASSCGSAYFGSLTSAADYSVSVTKTGYTGTTETNLSASGDTYYSVTLN